MKQCSLLHILVVACCLFPALLFPQPAPPNWSAWQFLIGDWVGEGGGTPGQGSGEFSFALDLQKQILVRRNFADYPAQKDRQAFRHEDLMIVYQSSDQPPHADYWDNEGHVIHYTVEFGKDSSSIVFVSDLVPSASRYRMIYVPRSDGKLRIVFDIAPPGHPDEFQEYIEATAHKK